ncbi:hypothetical protein NP233_g9963 [Leucocoprinus birnbaumii]|uniref:PX domain-containing protein n=1 Tax=Leucocoprinus birnbaumii TaxID=56174 RepID=A0AAD5VJ81_9AGAR|nr:hypothetical protein NP233_g9963 [Leucocoprinus birnbaumii]
MSSAAKPRAMKAQTVKREREAYSPSKGHAYKANAGSWVHESAVGHAQEPSLAANEAKAESGTSDFDACVNSSTAWTASLNDDGRKWAHALYVFDSQEEFREVTGISPGDDLEVIKEDLPDGWSLVRTADGQIGLLPQSYYTFTADFVSKPPGDDCPTPAQGSHITPQTTGEWHESWLLNGAPENDPDTLNETNDTHEARDDNDEDEELNVNPGGESERHFIDTGPSWKAKIPPFKILVHSPSGRTSVLSGSYTIYSITSLFSPADTYTPPYTSHHNCMHSDFIPRSMRWYTRQLDDITEEYNGDNEGDAEPQPLQQLTVHRHFSYFLALHSTLAHHLPALALPPLPPKQYTNRFSSTFIEARHTDLERYLNTLVRHSIIRYTEILTFFPSCDNDTTFHNLLPRYKALSAVGPGFDSKVYHPAFNLDVDDAKEAGEGFSAHVKSIKRSVQGLRGVFGKAREARVEMAKLERGLGYAILGMITAPHSEDHGEANGFTSDDEDAMGASKGKGKESEQIRGVVNSSGAWCWREDCKGGEIDSLYLTLNTQIVECLHLTRGLQKLSDTLQSVADLYDDHARRTQLATHESLKTMAHPDTIYAPILDTHNATLSRYQSALSDSSNDPTKAELASRCETVLNTTMSEMDTYHTQKVEDFHKFGVEHLDGEIQLYEQILTRLRAARSTLTSPPPVDPFALDSTTDSSITPSIYTRDLFPSTSPTSPGSSSSATSSSRFYPYSNSKLITTSHRFVPSSSATGPGTALGIGEVQIPALPMPAPHVSDGVSWNSSLM